MDETDAALWLHDAARPFVSQRILADVAQALEEHEAVTVAVPVTDTLYKVKGERLKVKVNSVPSRSEYMRAQTPQAFHLEVVADAYMRAIEADYNMATDDAGIVRKFASKHPIYIVMGEETNKKITYKEDL
jgi:2-C-methyl-D-erythritol 4-phosphate cytidylyltransferase